MARRFTFLLLTFWGGILLAQTSIFAPTDNLVQIENSVEFAWNECLNSSFYELQIDDNPGFLTPETNILFSTDTSINFTAGVYYYRVRCFINNDWSEWSGTRKFTILQLASLGNIVLWLDAGNSSSLNLVGGNQVGEWVNLMQTTQSFIQTNPSRSPLLINNISVLNNKSAIRFDGTDDFLSGGDILNIENNDRIFFIVGKSNSTSSGRFFAKSVAQGVNSRFSFGFSSGQLNFLYHDNSNRSLNTTTSNNQYNIYTLGVERSTPVRKLEISNAGNTLISSNNLSGNNFNFTSTFRFLLGASGNNNDTGEQAFLNGEISEFIIYNSVLTDSSRHLVEQYMRHKYAPPVNLGVDITMNYGFCDTVNLNAQKPWFTSYLWSTGATSPGIAVAETGSFWVEVTDVFGYVSRDTIIINGSERIFFAEQYNICFEDTLTINLSENNNINYQWSSGENSSFISITEPGFYSLTVIDTLNCSFTFQPFEAIIDSFSFRVSLGNDTSVCAGNTIGLVEGASLVESILWNTNETSETIIISNSGEYSVELTSLSGCVAKDTIFVTVLGVAPDVNFFSDTVCAGIATNFFNLTTTTPPSSIDLYTWSFDSLGSSNNQNPQFTFPQAGSYEVSLLAETNEGCSSSFSKNILVRGNPTAEILLEYPPCANNIAQFSALASAAANDFISSYSWNFGDNNTSIAINPTNIYASSGNYTVSLLVSTDLGCFNTSQLAVEVADVLPIPFSTNLSGPPNFFTGTNNNLTFEWWPAIGAINYILEISDNPNFSNLIFSGFASNDLSIDVLNLPYTNLFWRVKAFNSCGEFSLSETRSFTLFEMSSLGNLVLWLDASDTQFVVKNSNNLVNSWLSKSSNQLSFNQPTNLNQPLWIENLSLINNKSALRFNGANSFLNGGDVLNLENNDRDIFLVGNSNINTSGRFFAKTISGSAANRFSFGYSSNVLNKLYQDNSNRSINMPFNQTGFNFFNIEINRLSRLLTINKPGELLGEITNIQPNSYNFTSNFRFLIGASSNANDTGEQAFLNGDIAEFIIFDNVLSQENKTLVEQYIRYKYAPPVNLGPDIRVAYGFCDTTLNAEKPWFVSYLWNTGESSAQISVNKSGIYSVTATDIFGFQSTDSVQVLMDNPTLNPIQYLCLDESIGIDIFSGDFYTHVWNSSDSTSFFSTSLVGQYHYSIYDTIGCVFNDTITVLTDFFKNELSLGNDTSICAPGQLFVSEQGLFNILSFTWSTGENSNFASIINNGNYWLEAVNENGCVGTDTVFVNVPGFTPVVDFDFSGVLCENGNINFVNLSSVQGGSIANSSWSFGDGNSDNSFNPTHSYSNSGVFTVSLSVETSSGCVNNSNNTLTINANPIAGFNFEIICAQSSSQLTDASNPVAGSIAEWNWNFNNEAIASTANPIFNFENQGEYNVSLLVTNSFGCKDSIAQTIEVFPALLPDFTAENFCVGDSVRFQDATASFSVVGRLWSFGQPNAFSTLPNPAFRYSGAGIYNVTLTVENAIGCVNSITKPVEIFEVPVISIQSENACLGTEIDVWSVENTNVNDPVVSYNWSVNGISSPTNSDSIRVLIEETGSVSLTLDVITEGGCNASTSSSLQVLPLPLAAFSFSPNYGTAPQTIQFTNQSTGAVAYNWSFGDGTGESFDSNPTYIYTSNNNFLVVLEAFSADGCFSIAQRNVPIIPSELDIELSNLVLQPTLNNGISYVKPRVTVTNVGTRSVENIDFYVRLNEQVELFEKWEGLLPPAASFTFEFSGQYALTEGVNARYICVEARGVNDGTELNLENNKACKVLKGQVQLSEIYPNPATGRANIDMVTESSGTADLALYEVSGKKIFELKGYQLERGLNKISLDLSLLQSGKYNLTISYLNDEFVKPLLLINK